MNDEKLMQAHRERLTKHYGLIRADFKENVEPVLHSNVGKPLTKALLCEIEGTVTNFLNRHVLKIGLVFYHGGGNIAIYGRTLTDELIWEAITR